MDFNVKKLVGEAGSFISRAVQMTEEVIYSGEKTTLDPQLEGLSRQVDSTKTWTQRIAKDLDCVLMPNPGYRVEDYLMEKIEKKRPARLSNMECLGQGMIEAGNEFGASGAYGSMLIKVGQNELKLGQAERDFINGAVNAFTEPLNKFLDNEVKNATRERRTLENKRLDLDAAKNKLRKARSLSGQPTKDGTDPRMLILQAEREVISAQSEFTQQADVVRAQLDLVILGRDRHVEHLKALVAAQTAYYERCNQLMADLNRELHTMPIHSVNLNQSFSLDDSFSDDTGTGRGVRGKVMYDYVAKASDEISLNANEILTFEETSDPDYFYATKGNTRGKVPKSCVLIL
jgi:endophilin-B